ncbi:hypothetical protein IH575_01180 [Candidatus Dojkabacteria bacterium]|nr:hypothetical protein [Candidatus Dojkabacteria bacterium]
MERATYSVAFYVKRTKILKDETSPLYGRVTINGERAEFSIQGSISLEQWDYFRRTKNNNSNAAKLLNRYFDEVKRKLHQYQIDIEDRGEEVTAEALKNAYLGINKESKTILQVFKEHNDLMGRLWLRGPLQVG